MLRLQPRLIAAPPATFARFRRVGDASDLNASAGALLSSLQSSGCQPSAQANVTAFQTAWNAAWSANVLGPPMPGPLSVDGLYGANTSQALGAWMTSQGQDGTTVPSGCVPSSSAGSSSSTTNSTTTTTTTTNNSSIVPAALLSSLSSPFAGAPLWLWILGGVVGVGAFVMTSEHKGAKNFRRRAGRRRRGHAMRRRRRGRR